ncbi:hypothetical protein TrCOL_g12489 [Triparma columacea]|nr:hypothetical protein TrCOL_g12489 [Triparma columacea]
MSPSRFQAVTSRSLKPVHVQHAILKSQRRDRSRVESLNAWYEGGANKEARNQGGEGGGNRTEIGVQNGGGAGIFFLPGEGEEEREGDVEMMGESGAKGGPQMSPKGYLNVASGIKNLATASTASSDGGEDRGEDKELPPSPPLTCFRTWKGTARVAAVAIGSLATILIICIWLGPNLHNASNLQLTNLHQVKLNDSPGTVSGLSGASSKFASGTSSTAIRVLQTNDGGRIFDVRLVAGATPDSQDVHRRGLSGGGGRGKVKGGVVELMVTQGGNNCLSQPITKQLYQDAEMEFLETVKASAFTESGNCPSLDSLPIGSFQFVASVTSTNVPVSIVLEVVSLPGWANERVLISGLLLLIVYTFIVLDVVHRTLVAMCGAGAALFVMACMGEFRDIQSVVVFIDESTLALLFGMMVVVHLISTTGVFEYAAVRALESSGGRMVRLMVTLCAATAALSAFLDNVTTMLLLAPVTIEICRLIDVEPVPFLIAEVMFSNVGGTSTMIGDPPNIIIGSLLKKEVGFVDFIVNLMPPVLLMTPPTMMFLVWRFKDDIDSTRVRSFDAKMLRKQYPITNPNLLLETGIIMLAIMLLFFLEPVHHISTSWIAIYGAVGMMLVASPHDLHSVFENVEWDTLLFFAALFVMIEAMAEMGLIRWIGNVISDVIAAAPEESRMYVAITVILVASAIVSGFLDNIPYTTTMVPVIVQLSNDSTLNLTLGPLIWSLSLGACLGGNMTLVGASANLVTAGAAEHVGRKIGFVHFMKVGSSTVAITVAIALAWCLTVYGAAGWDGKISGGVDD